MAWTTPGTAVAGNVATAAFINIYRDDLNELRTGGIAIASQAAGDIITATGASQFGRIAAASGIQTFLTTPSSANLGSAVTEGRTGTGAVVCATSPTLVTPLLGTPTSGTLTNCTGYPAYWTVMGSGIFESAGAVTRYNSPTGVGNSSGSTEVHTRMYFRHACTVDSLYVNCQAAPGTGETLILTLRKNDSDQTLTVTVSGTSESGSDLVNSFTVVSGDYLTVKSAKSSGADYTLRHSWSIRITTT